MLYIDKLVPIEKKQLEYIDLHIRPKSGALLNSICQEAFDLKKE